MKCSNCNSEISMNDKLCGNCGAPIDKSNINAGGITCPACGKISKMGTRFCGGCGNSLMNESVAPSQVQPKVPPMMPVRKTRKGASPVLYVVLGLAIALLISTVVFFIMNMRDDKNDEKQDSNQAGTEQTETNEIQLSVDEYPSETEDVRYTITGSARSSNIDAVLTINEEEVVTVLAGDVMYWDKEVVLEEGKNTFKIVLDDGNGNVETEKIHISYIPVSDEHLLSDEYLFPSDRVYITYSDLEGMSKEEVALIRNEIYARHGYIFKTETYIEYFSEKSWYSPNPYFSENLFNSVELANKDFLIEYEESRGWR